MKPPSSEQLLSDPIACYPAATVACLDATRGELPRRELDHARNVRFLERLAAAGVPAALIAASTGHGHLRTVGELERWFESAAQARRSAMTLMALLRPEDGREANEHLLDSLARLGYAVVFLRPGTNLPGEASADAVVDQLQPLVAAAARRGLAVGVYSIPDVSGLPLAASTAAMLLDGPGADHLVAAKVTEADYDASTRQYLEHPRLRHWKIVQGWDPHLARALEDGPRYDERRRQRCGVTSGPMSLAVFQYLHLLQAAAAGEWAEVAAAQQAVTILFQSMQDAPDRFADLQRAKWIMGLGHPLLGEVTDEQVQRVLDALANVPRAADRQRLALSLDLLGDGPFHEQLRAVAEAASQRGTQS